MNLLFKIIQSFYMYLLNQIKNMLQNIINKYHIKNIILTKYRYVNKYIQMYINYNIYPTLKLLKIIYKPFYIRVQTYY
ncbi:hypothetical protein PFBG_01364 [Plasmodium falciparum 7G8]|uniref:Uncharacterized protein n=4 Tax=Plasmodium falciparum TaxID=5833 RepID=W7JXR6_PLAFO|nr:hypothetical protein PFNF135_01471 [Plasmodium falciparum NF135/5.C10]ETW62719.1 hypothetical protein PFMC_01383 [Plasmodium falciparum CAMP/Malaysia]EUR75240.1 hypothetical protein PFBG_01364 [Plasmodium falciparum 7G8]EWC89843.1 hypothetical protein PFNF54_01421 [Plasmodium falciparum NF54]